MNKTTKIPLITAIVNLAGEEVDYKDVFKILWKLQDQTREVKNKTIQMLWEWSDYSSDYKKKNGIYPKPTDISKYKMINGYIYDVFKDDYILNSNNLITSIRAAEAQFKAGMKDYIKGEKSIIEYKNNQPLDLHNYAIKLCYDNNEFTFKLGLLNNASAKEYGIKGQMTFKAVVRDKSVRTILERCYDGVYHISASKLAYNKKKKQWFLLLSYGFTPDVVPTLDENKILGVDLGVKFPLVASVYGDYNRLSIPGGEIEHIRNVTEKRRRSLLKQGAFCGDGRIGHGYKTRVKPVEKISDKVSRSRDTINHKYSRELINYAIKNGCGIIQMEQLSGVTANADKFLKNWSYFDLQSKIEYKATEKGIKVQYINPRYTSQRCSKCGFIHSDNRPDQATFKCQACGFETNADYNASQNIGIKDIDKIIAESMKSKKSA